ncbi:retrovirus-related Pol polyprotein from transposon TNT 1-94 [Trichonephila clavipes]|uniref:Retrovirus-related Pol polyprotein from transposon TNT 1-94 n=1 Tax=Trichonephila clavipes TaxID=2585209 RepID=A0A8X6RU47_TRICX|nr:retrovirus-related Pol polyprotein from transposon TNT 1-94 [Trichonephila clavipes]
MPYTPQQNGVAGRENRTIVECARSIIYYANLPLKLWAEAVNTSVYVLNRTGPTSVKDKSPYELWFSKEVISIDHLRVFGTECFVHVPQQKRRKWDKKSVKGVFVGYSGEKDGYRIWIKDQNKVILSRDVVFQNEKSSCVPDVSSDIQNSDMEIVKKPLQTPDPGVGKEIEEIPFSAEDREREEILAEQSCRNLHDRSILKMPAKFDNFVLLAEHIEPDTYKEAIASEDSDKWLAAMKEELESLSSNNTWVLANLPSDRKAIGFSQKFEVDFSETFSPVVRWDTIRIVLSIAAARKLKLGQFDVKTAFLYGDLSEDIYMAQPEGFSDSSGQVCKLLKSIYGLKQAPRCWNKRFKSYAENSGLKQSNCDPCLFFNDEKSMYLIVYVDDGIIVADEEQTGNLFLKKLESEFSVVIGEANYFLGMQIEHLECGKIFIHQEAYCRKILSRFDMINSNHVSTPIEKGAISTDDSVSLSADVPYREAVGSLMFLDIVTRPDIAYAVGVLYQVFDKPQQIHWTMVKRILRYLNGTKKYGIMYLSVSSATLESYSDSDYVGDPLTRRSTSGMVFKYNGGAIAWRSQRQSCIALSTTEAEFIVASQAAKEAIWLNNLFKELCCVTSVPSLQIDNQSAIRLVKNPEFHNRTKHIDIRYKFIREQYENKQLNVINCSSEIQLLIYSLNLLLKIDF